MLLDVPPDDPRNDTIEVEKQGFKSFVIQLLHEDGGQNCWYASRSCSLGRSNLRGGPLGADHLILLQKISFVAWMGC